jgi:hypothetical protein
MTSCASEELLQNPHQSIIHVSLRAATESINEDKTLWEDRVDEVRMIAFDQTGKKVFNDMLNFPNGFTNHCEGIPFTPGTYDFYFFANESANATFSAALSAVNNVSQFQTDTRFQQVQYNRNFVPDGTSTAGRFLMSAKYTEIQVFSGGTRQNPNPLILPTGKVELIRALAKVDVVFLKKVAGSSIPANSITSVQLQNVANNSSVPPIDANYTGSTGVSNAILSPNFNYANDSIGTVGFYIPEFLTTTGSTNFTQLKINDKTFPIQSDDQLIGLTQQRRTISGLSANSVIRNYHYVVDAYINAAGGVELKVCVKPWNKDAYQYIFQDPSRDIVVPPIVPTDSSVIVPTPCGKIEIRSTNELLLNGLMAAYGDVINWWDPAVNGPSITKGNPPYYCEQKYGPGWRLINSCELMSFLGLFDQTYRIWQSNTWVGINNGLTPYTIPFRQAAQDLLKQLTGADMSKYTMSDTQGGDNFGSEKLGMLDNFFTPGDIMLTENDYPNGWPFATKPNDNGNKWHPQEVVVQLKGFWYTGYIPITPENYNAVLYQRFEMYSFNGTVSRCVREVD